jgi:hypothetical protein
MLWQLPKLCQLPLPDVFPIDHTAHTYLVLPQQVLHALTRKFQLSADINLPADAQHWPCGASAAADQSSHVN